MKKREIIEEYGKQEYERRKEQNRKRTRLWREKNVERDRVSSRNWSLQHPAEVRKTHQNQSRKGGRFYVKKQLYDHIGLQGERNKIRSRDWRMWHTYKQIIAPDSQLHHEWVPRTAEYNGLALVEKDQHQHGSIDVIEILDGEITVFTEQELREPENMDVLTT